MSENKVVLFFNLKGTLFSNIFLIQAKLSELGHFRRFHTNHNQRDHMFGPHIAISFSRFVRVQVYRGQGPALEARRVNGCSSICIEVPAFKL